MAWYSDTMVDKPLLERHFPSLLAEVHSLTKHGDLPLLVIPPEVTIKVSKRASEIQGIIFTLLDGLDNGQRLVVGLDSEWNVDMDARRHNIPDQRQTAILQIAHGNNILIFQVSSFIQKT